MLVSVNSVSSDPDKTVTITYSGLSFNYSHSIPFLCYSQTNYQFVPLCS